MQRLDLANTFHVAVEGPLARARTVQDVDATLDDMVSVVNQKRRAYVAAGKWDDDLENARQTLQDRLHHFRQLVVDLMRPGPVAVPSTRASPARSVGGAREDCAESGCAESESPSWIGDDCEGREGCSSDSACVGSAEDGLFQLTGGYFGVFCAKCVEILNEADPNLVAKPLH